MSATPSTMIRALLVTVILGVCVRADCPEGEGLTFVERFDAAEIVLFGVETTEVSCEEDDPGHCIRTQIQFDVYCILKNTQGVDIQPTITIGDGVVDECTGTYFPYDPTADLNRELVVMVTYDAATQTYAWHEVETGESASFEYIDDLQPHLAAVCWPTEWATPANAVANATCPDLSSAAYSLSLRYPNPASLIPGSFCCATLEEVYGYSDISVVTSCTSVGNAIVQNEPTVIFGGDGCDENSVYTVVMVRTPDNMSDVTVYGFTYDLGCSGMELTSSSAGQLIYDPPLVMGNDVQQYAVHVYEQSGEISAFNASDYSTEECTWCSFNLEQFVTDKDLTLYGEIQLPIHRDLYSSLVAYQDSNMIHADVCHWIYPDLATIDSYAVCPPPVALYSGSSITLSRVSPLSILLPVTLISWIVAV